MSDSMDEEIKQSETQSPAPGPDGAQQAEAAPESYGPHARRNAAVIIVVVVAIAVMLIGGQYLVHKGERSGRTTAGGPKPGSAAPDFALQSLEGKTVHLTDFRGKAVLLNFWATWCTPCRLEMPWFVELQKQYGPEGLEVLGVAMDDAGKDKIATPRTSRPSGPYCFCSSTNHGISSRHGVHQVAQKFSSTALPRKSIRCTVLPSSDCKAKSGAAEPGLGPPAVVLPERSPLCTRYCPPISMTAIATTTTIMTAAFRRACGP